MPQTLCRFKACGFCCSLDARYCSLLVTKLPFGNANREALASPSLSKLELPKAVTKPELEPEENCARGISPYPLHGSQDIQFK
jgi:hypothetical protein